MLTRNNAVRSFRPFCGSLHVSHYSTVPTTTTAPPTSIQTPSPFNSGRFVKSGPGGRSSVSGHTVTVFGCTGFMGKRGTQVVLPYRGNQEDPRHLKVMGDLGQMVPLRFDPNDDQSIAECVRHSDTVYNLIGRDYETSNFSFQQVHVDVAQRIARIAKREGVQRFIHVSALNADPDSSSAFYASKGEGELAVRKAFPESIIVRPGTCYGFEDRLFSYLGQTLTHPIKKYLTLGVVPLLDGGKREFYPIYVGDVTRGLYQLSETESPKSLYEFHGPEVFTYREIVELFCEFARRPCNTLSLNASLYRALVQWTQLNPLRRITVADIDRWMVDDRLTAGAGQLSELGVQAQNVESLFITFVRHYRSRKWADQPASLAELKYYERANVPK